MSASNRLYNAAEVQELMARVRTEERYEQAQRLDRIFAVVSKTFEALQAIIVEHIRVISAAHGKAGCPSCWQNRDVMNKLDQLIDTLRDGLK